MQEHENLCYLFFFFKKNNGVNTNCIIIISKTYRIHDLNLFKKNLMYTHFELQYICFGY